MDNNGSLDIIVAGQDNVTILYNGGMGTNEKLSVSKQTLATFDGVAYQVRAFDLNLDQRLDLIFTSFSMDHDPVRVFIQDSSGKFNETANAFPDLDHIKSNKFLSYPLRLILAPVLCYRVPLRVKSYDNYKPGWNF